MDMGMGVDMGMAIVLLFRFVSDGLWVFPKLQHHWHRFDCNTILGFQLLWPKHNHGSREYQRKTVW
jgi:hypothetical protein